MAYARHVLNEFGKELDLFRGEEEDFRSKVLNPILQRQLHGLSDAYAPPIASQISTSGKEVTIADATMFYLSIDPLDPSCIPTYRRNLIYIREATWHLACLLKKIAYLDREEYNWVLEVNETVLYAIRKRPDGETSFPPFSAAEVEAMVVLGIQDWFAEELEEVVRTGFSSNLML